MWYFICFVLGVFFGVVTISILAANKITEADIEIGRLLKMLYGDEIK